MARPKKTDAPDLSARVNLSMGAIERLTCPPGKTQAFMRDTEAPGLRVRVTAAGAKSFVFERKLNRRTVRRTIGDVRSWTIEAARKEANRLAVLIDDGVNPAEQEREQQAAQEAQRAADAAQQITVGDLWPQYLQEGRPRRREAWKPRYRADLEAMAAPGGVPRKRGQGVTRPGPLYPLMALPLASIDGDALSEWYEREAKAGRYQAARALMMFRGFLRWASGKRDYRELTDRDAGKAEGIADNLPPLKKRTDHLEATQVAAWWAGCGQVGNPVASVYLLALLLTGARREEMAALKWADIDFRWRKLTIADKVEATRTIPLTPYLAQLLVTLPRAGTFVFASTSKTGRISDARASHARVLEHAGIEHLTVHGLRRSYSLLGEAAGAPAGAIAQIMGHRPSAVAEGYRPRSIDALRPYAELVEAHILQQAGVQFDATSEPGKLRAVR